MNRILIDLKRFASQEDGAVTVDWVVLTAGVVGMVALAMAGLTGNMTSIAEAAADYVAGQTINSTFN